MGLFRKKPEKEFLKAADKGNLDEMRVLLDSHPENDFLSAKDFVEGDTALHLASRNGHLEVVEFLLSKGVDINLQNNFSCTPLSLAVSHGHLEIVKFLIRHGSDVNERDNLGTSPLLSAVMVLPFLDEKGQDVSGNYSVRKLGDDRYRKEIIKLLIEEGADVNAANEEGETPLWTASLHGDKEIVELLIKIGADVNTYDNKYRITPLHMVAELGQIEIVELLLENGAYINPISRKMNTPLDSAKENVIDLLVSKGGKRERSREN